MFAENTVDIASTYDDENWLAPSKPPLLYRAASVGNSWGVTSIGRGFDWSAGDQEMATSFDSESIGSASCPRAVTPVSRQSPSRPVLAQFTSEPLSISPSTSQPNILSPQTHQARSSLSPNPSRQPSPIRTHAIEHRPSLSRSPTAPRPRRRSSQQRVSLIAGRVMIAPVEPPSPPPAMPQVLQRVSSSGSVISMAASTDPPTPSPENQSFLGDKSITDFLIEAEIGRGAYGLVKRARRINADGSHGPPLVIKQVIKSRILADCWKRHPKFGTIPIEIYVMSAISSTSYSLPNKRPWDPSRKCNVLVSEGSLESSPTPSTDEWQAGKVVKGHPNICPLLEFFEDNHYYYLVLPSSTPEHQPDKPTPPSDLFDLVEAYPTGLPPCSVRSYLGQLSDALCFLHSRGIVHRDVKDENVVLGPNGKCILIDFGSSGLVKKSGWDTFSGTLDYAGPEILRGERYHGKEQDVWAFGVVAYVLLVGECPFTTAAEAQDGLDSPFANASIALDERCGDDKETEGEEADGGGALGDAAALVKACLQVDIAARPTFEDILQCRFLAGGSGWGLNTPFGKTSQARAPSHLSAFPSRMN